MRKILREYDCDDITNLGRYSDAKVTVSNIEWDSDEKSRPNLPTKVKVKVPYIGDIDDDNGNTIESKRLAYIEEIQRALNGYYHAWPCDFDFFIDDYGPDATYESVNRKMSFNDLKRLVMEDANDNNKSRTESLKLTADYLLGQIRGLSDKVAKNDQDGAKLFFRNVGITLKDLVRQFEDFKNNF